MNRAHTSEYRGKDLRRPDRRTAMKVLVDKTFSFVNLVRMLYIAENKVDTRYRVHLIWLCHRSLDVMYNILPGQSRRMSLSKTWEEFWMGQLYRQRRVTWRRICWKQTVVCVHVRTILVIVHVYVRLCTSDTWACIHVVSHATSYTPSQFHIAC